MAGRDRITMLPSCSEGRYGLNRSVPAGRPVTLPSSNVGRNMTSRMPGRIIREAQAIYYRVGLVHRPLHRRRGEARPCPVLGLR
jgi:hypothetical protein